LTIQTLERNGYKCLYKQREGTVSTVRVVVNVGSTSEDESVYGIAHFAEHMFFKGCQSKSSKEIRDLMGLYGSANAYTDFMRTVYRLNCLSKDVFNSLNLMAEVLFQPQYKQEEMDKEANVISEEIQTRLDDPNSYFFDQGFQLLIPGYGHSIAGSKESVQSLKVSDLEKFVSSHYLKDNFCFAVVTPTPVEDVQAMFNYIIDTWSPSGSTTDEKKIVTKSTPEFLSETKKLEHCSEQAVIAAVYRGCTTEQENEFNFVDDVFHNAFGGELHSILFDRVREKLGLCYYVSSFEHRVGIENRTLFYAMLKKENVDQAFSEIEKCFKEVQENGIDDNLLRIAKKNSVMEMANTSETASGYSSIFIDRYFEVGIRSFDDVASKMMSIENKDIIEFARWLDSSPKQLLMMNVD